MPQDRAQGWVVMKFGGTSVSSAECWDTIREQVRRHLNDGGNLLVVVSALSGVTNALSRLADGADADAKAAIRAGLAAQHEALIGQLGLQARGLFDRHWLSLSGLVEAAGPRMDDPSRALLLAHGELLSSSIGYGSDRKAGKSRWKGPAMFSSRHSGNMAVPPSEPGHRWVPDGFVG